jgi:hypothetical protein
MKRKSEIRRQHLPQYVSEIKDVLTSDGKVLLFQACGCLLSHNSVLKRIFQWRQAYRFAVVGLRNRPGRQPLIGESSATRFGSYKFSTFAIDQCKAFVWLHVTFKINSFEVRKFLMKCTETVRPAQSTSRTDSLPKWYEEVLNKIGEFYEMVFHKLNNRWKWKEYCKCCYWGFGKCSNAIRETISSLMPGNVFRIR